MAGNLYLSVDYGRAGGPLDDAARPWTRQDPPFYGNSSIWLEPGINRATVGEPSFIHVRVSNKGDTTMTQVHVQTFLFTPTVGVAPTWQGSTKKSASKDKIPPGSGTFAPNDENVVKIGPWTPTADELQGDGHMCLIANVFQSPDDTANPDPGGEEIGSGHDNPMTHPKGAFNPNGEQHQGQRNIQLLKAKQQDPAPVKVVYTTRPPQQPVHPQYRVSLHHVDIDGFTPDELFTLSRQPEVELTGSKSEGSELLLKTTRGTEAVSRGPRPLSFDLKAEGIPGIGQTFVRDAEMPQDIPSVLEVQIDPKAPVGSLHTFDITLHDEKELIGSGLRVMILVTE
ncbi:hypothetical protein ACWCOW_31595 [Streptomyces sp. NPDC001939]